MTDKCRGPGRDVAGDGGTGLLRHDARGLEYPPLRQGHAGVVLRELDETRRHACVGHALVQLGAQEVGDLLDRRGEGPVGHERLPVDAGHQHGRQLRLVGNVLDDVRTPAHALGRELDEHADAERLGVLDPRPDDLVDQLRVGVEVGHGRHRSQLHEHVVVGQDPADLVLGKRSSRRVEDRPARFFVLAVHAPRPERREHRQGAHGDHDPQRPHTAPPPPGRGGLHDVAASRMDLLAPMLGDAGAGR